MGALEKLREENGSTIVEAAMVMPLLIISLIAIVITIVFLVESLFMQSNIHLYLQEKAGIKSETRIIKSVESFNETEDRRNMVKVLSVNKTNYMKGGYLLPRTLRDDFDADAYVINEKKIIRYKDFFGKAVF